MLIVPLALGLIIAPAWHWRALALVGAALCFFLMRSPLVTLVKTRKRSGPTAKTYLWSWAAIYGGLTTLSGGWLILDEGLWGLVAGGAVGAATLLLHLWLVSRREEMSVMGELAGIVGLALGAPLAYYAATGQLDGVAGLLWALNALYFGGTVFYIKLKVRQQPRRPAPPGLRARLEEAHAGLVYHAAALAIAIGLAGWGIAPRLVPLVFVPAAAKMLYGAWRWQDKKSLNITRLGVIELLHALIFSALVILSFKEFFQ
jgi:hypothetical protein